MSDLGDLVAPLIGARKGEVVFQPNVTLSHAVVFSADRFSGARNKIVTDAMHFPSILYLIDEQRKHSAEVDVVPSHDGITVDTDALLDHIDERTAIVNVSHVLFKSAYIHDVAAITAKARRVGAMTVIDGYQAVGTIPVDVRALGIDVYIGGCLKWLCGGPGAAFLWVDPTMRERLEPALTGWMAHQRPFSFERSQDRRTDAWRLLHGTPSIPALYAAKPGLELINEVGIAAIREKSQRQTQRLTRSRRPRRLPLHHAARPRGAAAPSPSMSSTRTRSPRASRRSTSFATIARARAFASLLISTTSTRSSTPPSKRSARSDRPAPGGHSPPTNTP